MLNLRVLWYNDARWQSSIISSNFIIAIIIFLNLNFPPDRLYWCIFQVVHQDSLEKMFGNLFYLVLEGIPTEPEDFFRSWGGLFGRQCFFTRLLDFQLQFLVKLANTLPSISDIKIERIPLVSCYCRIFRSALITRLGA